MSHRSPGFLRLISKEREEKKHFNAAISKYVLYRHMQCLISRLICDAQNNHLEVASTLNQRTRKPQTNHNSHLIKKKKKNHNSPSQGMGNFHLQHATLIPNVSLLSIDEPII